jgi:hypothetical protein
MTAGKTRPNGKVQNASTLMGILNEHTHRGRCGIDACLTFLNQETKYRIGPGTAVRRHAWKGKEPHSAVEIPSIFMVNSLLES